MTLKQRRKAKKLTQAQLAMKLGITERQFRKYVKHEVDPQLHIAIKWAEVLGIGIAKFVALYYKEEV